MSTLRIGQEDFLGVLEIFFMGLQTSARSVLHFDVLLQPLSAMPDLKTAMLLCRAATMRSLILRSFEARGISCVIYLA